MGSTSSKLSPLNGEFEIKLDDVDPYYSLSSAPNVKHPQLYCVVGGKPGSNGLNPEAYKYSTGNLVGVYNDKYYVMNMKIEQALTCCGKEKTNTSRGRYEKWCVEYTYPLDGVQRKNCYIALFTEEQLKDRFKLIKLLGGGMDYTAIKIKVVTGDPIVKTIDGISHTTTKMPEGVLLSSIRYDDSKCPGNVDQESFQPITNATPFTDDGYKLMSVNGKFCIYNSEQKKIVPGRTPTKSPMFGRTDDKDRYISALRAGEEPVVFHRKYFDSDKPLGSPMSYKEYFDLTVKTNDVVQFHDTHTNLSESDIRVVDHGPTKWILWKDPTIANISNKPSVQFKFTDIAGGNDIGLSYSWLIVIIGILILLIYVVKNYIMSSNEFSQRKSLLN
jgi:hypothetical protein